MGSRRGSAQEARGSSVLHGDVDAVVVLEQRRASGDFTINFELRWAREPAGMILSLDGDRLIFSIKGRLGSSSKKSSDEGLLRALREGGECTAAQFAEKAKVTPRTVQRNLNRLKKSGRVTCRVGLNRTKIWSISEDEDELFDSGGQSDTL